MSQVLSVLHGWNVVSVHNNPQQDCVEVCNEVCIDVVHVDYIMYMRNDIDN